MQTLPLKTDPPFSELLRLVEQLSLPELEQLIAHITEIYTYRKNIQHTLRRTETQPKPFDLAPDSPLYADMEELVARHTSVLQPRRGVG